MKIQIKKVKVAEGNLFLYKYRKALIKLIGVYLNDEMGEKRSLAFDQESRLVSGIIAHPAVFVFFAEYTRKIIGLAVCFLGFSTFNAKKMMNIHDLVVLPKFRRQGVAGKILASIEKKARDLDCCKLTLEVRADNIKAMKLYRQRGFSAGQHPMYFWTKEIPGIENEKR